MRFSSTTNSCRKGVGRSQAFGHVVQEIFDGLAAGTESNEAVPDQRSEHSSDSPHTGSETDSVAAIENAESFLRCAISHVFSDFKMDHSKR